MRNAELYLKQATVIYGFHPLAARLPELGVKFGKTGLLSLVKLRTLISRRVSDDTKLLSILTKLKLLIINRDSSVGILCHCFTS